MADLNPLKYRYGSSQGRILPGRFIPQDGDYVFCLGADIDLNRTFIPGDFVSTSQMVDLSDITLIRLAAGFRQPLQLPTHRVISGHLDGSWVYTASLKQGDVLNYTHPKTQAVMPEPYSLPDPGTLKISVNGGTDQTIAFPSSPTPYSIAQLIALINPQLSGAAAGTLQTETGYHLVLMGDDLGKTATIQMTGGTLNSQFLFPTRVCYGGDNLPALIAPDAHFTAIDVGRPISITGASHPENNKTNVIMKVASPTLAVLYDTVIEESPGFDVELLALRWQSTLLIDDVIQKQVCQELGRYTRTNDLALNVSKLSGAHKVTFHLELVVAT